jgi:hypothetical protein
LWLGCGESSLAGMKQPGPERESARGTPGWMTVVGIVVVILVVTVFVVLHLTGVLGPEAH